MSYFKELRKQATLGACLFALLSNSVYAGQSPSSASAADHTRTESPIKHLIVLIGENRTFDHIFATYVSPSHRQAGRVAG
jgi:phospholipase C